jgi:hypothetical protein
MDLLLGLLFGAVGSFYIAYARRQRSAMFLITGVALIAYPFFVENLVLIVLIGLALAAVPIAYARGWFGEQ